MGEDEIDPDHPLVQFARGDEARARYLRGRLSQVAERTDDPELRDLLLDVARGRRTMRDLGSSEVFGRHAAAGYEHHAARETTRSTQDRLRVHNEAQAEAQRVMGARVDELRQRFEQLVEQRRRSTDG